MSVPDRRVLLGLSLVCAANLLLEVSLTRIFSALMFYHFTFFAIALALLGIGASGVYVYVRSDRFTAHTVHADLARYARWFAAATLVALIYVLSNPVVVYIEFGESPTFTNQTLFQLVLLCGVAAMPFFWAGMVVSLAITHFRAAIDRVYFYDLAGAGLAALVVGLAIGLFGGPGLVVGVALLACVASVLFQRSTTAIAALVGATLLFLAAASTGLFAPPSTKMVHSDRVVFDGWNTFSHITLEEVGGGHDIRIDAAARTHVTKKAEASNPAWASDITALAYHEHPSGADSVLIIGPGGGVDVAHALASGAKHVTGVDINPLIAGTIMKGRYKKLSDGLYDDPRVTIRIDEGRSFIRRSTKRYDIIQATLVDTWAATASGAFALTENTLYTVEAFSDYYNHLSPSGVLTMSRWWTFASAPETLRLVVLAAAALEHRGIKPGMTQHHLFLVRKDNLSTLLVKPAGFTPSDTSQLVELSTANGYEVLIGPNIAHEPNLARFLTAGAWSDTVRAYPLDMRPPTDDRPFFFYFVKSSDLFSFSNLTDKKLANPALWLLASLGSMLVALTIIFVFLPLFFRLDDLRGPRLRRRLLGLSYFAAIGFGFMVVEIALIQRLSLFLGHPSYSLIVVLFGILVGTALGARSTRHLSPRASLAGGLVVALLSILAAFFLAGLLLRLITLPLPARMALAAAIVFVFGLVMGVMLPLGVTLLARDDERIIPWAWGINGGMSVIGTVCATIVAINAGFTATFLVGAALYIAAGTTGFWLARGD
jgi:spermidine synthase